MKRAARIGILVILFSTQLTIGGETRSATNFQTTNPSMTNTFLLNNLELFLNLGLLSSKNFNTLNILLTNSSLLSNKKVQNEK